jgi:phosphoglycerate dehydrogenase-like enzyme
MAKQRINVVVWDSIGNTVLGVRPWSSWEPAIVAEMLRERPDAETAARPLRDILADYDVDLIWFNSADAPYAPFGQLYADYDGALRFTKSVEEIGRAVEDADFLILHKETLPDEYVERARNLRLIQHLGQDYRGVPMEAARARNIPVAATPLVNYITVAEQVWAYILSWAKRLPALRAHMTARDYAGTWSLFPHTRYLGDMTLGLLGLGEIARPVARAAKAFGMPAVYWDITRFPHHEEAYDLTFVEWDDLFRTADVVTVQLALNDKTMGIIGAREFDLMKPDALFVNTARGKLVDQTALTEAIRQGTIGAVALDVYVEEPLPPDDPLLALHDEAGDERVTLTPHNAWQNPWTWVRDSQELWYNILRSLRNEPVDHLV